MSIVFTYDMDVNFLIDFIQKTTWQLQELSSFYIWKTNYSLFLEIYLIEKWNLNR